MSSTALAERPSVASSLVIKLAAVMGAVHHIPKRGRNQHFGYDFATEADIVAAIRQELAQRHVMLIPGIKSEQRIAIGETSKGAAKILTQLAMTFTFMDGETGEVIERDWLGSGLDSEDKGVYKAMTGAEKYFLLKTFLVPTGDDPEHDDKKPSARTMYAVQGAKEIPQAESALPNTAPGRREGGVAHVVHAPGTVGLPANSINPQDFATTENTAPAPPLAPGTVLITRVDTNLTKNKNVRKYFVTLSTGEVVTTIKEQLGALCEQLAQENLPVTVETKTTQWGVDLVAVHRVAAVLENELEPAAPLTSDEIPF